MQRCSVVVTGATGLVGTKVVQKLLAAGDTVHAVVRRQPSIGHPATKNTTSDVTLHTVDLLASKPDWTWMEAIEPVAVVHCAAMTNVDDCERDPAGAYAINEHATRSLAEACARYGVHLLVVSTDYVFDGSNDHPGPYSETDPVHPINHYGRSKWRGEIAVQEVCEGKTAWSICRTAVVYGSTPWTRANFATWLLAKLRNGESTRIVYDQICSPTLADDLADMLIGIMRQRAGGVFHTAGSTILDRYQFALALANQFGLESALIQPVATSELRQVALRPLKAGLCVDKVKQKLGIVPLSLDKALLQLMESDL
jgi:dTDP-4-dehydrorhamnose reductase